MRFRPCIDLHAGKVKQIVGSTLSDGGDAALETNFETSRSAADFAAMYRDDGLPGGHVIMLGAGCEEAALAALAAYPGGMQIGGGIQPSSARRYLEAGASHVIVTSYLFRDGRLAWDRLEELRAAVGRDRLVLDLSCRRLPPAEWQRYTDARLTRDTVARLATHCCELLVHGVEAEGKRCGILEDLVRTLGEWSPVPVTYAGGARGMEDLDRVRELGDGKVDLTIGSALDIFGGDVLYRDVVAWQRRQEEQAEQPPR
ncbi:unnamed protein product [Phaeothamnion confervicola]